MNAPVSQLAAKQKTNNTPELSFEFFPAKTPRMERNLWRTMGQLELLNPGYFSMTYGALGSERDHSLNMVSSMLKEGHVPVAAHLTSAGHTRDSLIELVQHFHNEGVQRIVALRGDADMVEGGITDVAVMVEELLGVADFDISVAAYPEVHPKAKSLQADLAHLKRKLDAGAQRALTQYFFDADVFLRFRDEAEKAGITQQLVPGILPIHDFAKVTSFSSRCGANVPEFMHDLFAGTEAGSAEQKQIGIDHATKLGETLLAEGVDALHFYTLNMPNLSFEVARNLGVSKGDVSVSKAA
uniref:Methylenetetrahydrofolate reductase n=1 Tax=uncultured Thiotrichaceae bacterium TaxID=298394 RepID=A0A6S6UCI7_9GAMM|nr:MAG: 5,10-methylenetetrahydrofolate reductase (EC [uncultured Thiotrichaceae bacterium]